MMMIYFSSVREFVSAISVLVQYPCLPPQIISSFINGVLSVTQAGRQLSTYPDSAPDRACERIESES